MRLNSNVSAIVTGGASGLGAATARRLAMHGVKVALFDLDEQLGGALAAEINGLFCRVDVTSEDEVAAGFALARKHHGQERIFINCAGAGKSTKIVSRDRQTGEIHRLGTEAFERILQINLVGTFRCTAHAAEGMLSLTPLEDGERAVIINTASVAAEDGQMGQAAYSASKAGIVGMMLPIARDLANEGIRINTILPGIFDTPLMRRAAPRVIEGLAAAVPFPKRLGSSDEYAALAIHMIENVYLNAEKVRLDGAIRMSPK